MGLGTFASGIWNQVNPLDDGRTYADASREAEYQDQTSAYYDANPDLSAGQDYVTLKQMDSTGDFGNYLDSGSSSGSTLGAQTGAVEGAMYYDSATGQVMEYRNGQWVVSGGSSPTPSGGGGGGSTTPAAPAYDQNEYNYLTNQISLAEGLIPTAETGLQNVYDTIDSTYGRDMNDANSQRSQALEDYGIQRQDFTQGRQDALGQVNANSRTLAESLRRIIGMASGTGSSAYRFAAPNAVSRLSSGERGNVIDTYGRNDRNLTLAENRSTSAFDKLLEDLAFNKLVERTQAESQTLGQKQNIYNDIANLYGERAALTGGDYGAVQAAQAPWLSKYQQAQSKINALPKQYNAPVTINPVSPETPELSDYTVDRHAINANKQFGGNSNTSPYSYFLKRKFNEETQ